MCVKNVQRCLGIVDRVLSRARLRSSLPTPRIRRLIRPQAALTQSDIADALGVNRASVSSGRVANRIETATSEVGFSCTRTSISTRGHGYCANLHVL
jgi:hypothetical protein